MRYSTHLLNRAQVGMQELEVYEVGLRGVLELFLFLLRFIHLRAT